MSSLPTESRNVRQADDVIRLQDLLYLCLSHWRWFLLALLVTLGTAVAYLLITPPVYTRTAAILIKEDAKGKSVSGADEVFADFGMFQSNTNVNNELIALQSPVIMTAVVNRLHLEMNYSVSGTFHRQSLYGATLPATVTLPDAIDNEAAACLLEIRSDGTLSLSDFEKEGEPVGSGDAVTGALRDTLATPLGRVVVTPTPYLTPDTEYRIAVNRADPYATVTAYSAALQVSLSDEKASVISLSIDDVSIQRADDILNMIIAVYNENWIADKNRIAVSTSLFIDERLRVIERELSHVDEDISTYKSDHLLPDVQAVSNMYMTQSGTDNVQLLNLNTRLSMVRYLRNNLASAGGKHELLPVNTGIESVNIESQIESYNTMQLQRNSLVANSSERNPLVIDLDSQLASMSEAILSSIDNLVATLGTQIRDLQRNMQQTTSRIAATPNQAKYLLSVERQQKVKESLYLFLLQKREENELSQAFTAYNTRIISPPGGKELPTAPVKRNILLVALALGLLIPVVILVVRENMNSTVRGRKDLEGLPMPFVGEIPLVPETRGRGGKRGIRVTVAGKLRPGRSRKAGTELLAPVVKAGKRDIINEAFRVLRTNLEFMQGTEGGADVMLLTSFNPGSGKTFISVNLAVSLAIKGKRVLAIDGDMRHASLSAYLSQELTAGKMGLSNYLGNQVETLEEIILHHPDYPGLDIIRAGTIPPNPTELLFSQRLDELISQARTQYDYVLIDCPPVDIVADTTIIEKYVDRCLFVVRAGLMERSMTAELTQKYNDQKLKNLTLVLNGTNSAEGRYGYRYQYGYRYGYRYGYHYGHGYHYGEERE
jgi:capsular exopolysaccharide synthesis family protein